MKLAKTYPIHLICRLLGVPRNSVYYEPTPTPDEVVQKTITRVYTKFRLAYSPIM